MSGRDTNRGLALLVVSIIATGLAVIFTIVRVFVRAKIIKKLGWDDMCIVVASVFAVLLFACLAFEVHEGIGLHRDVLSPEQVEQISKWNHLGVLPKTMSVVFTKVSICLFLARFFTIEKTWGWCLYSMITFVWISNLPQVVAILFLCRPLAKVWRPSTSGQCLSQMTFVKIGYWQGASSVFCDLTLALLPTVFLWNMQIRLRVKIGICMIMGLGIFTAVCAFIRTVLLGAVADQDFTYRSTTLIIWTLMEESVGIIAACIPTLKPLFTGFGKPQRSRYTVRQNLQHRSNPSHSTPDLFFIESALDFSTEAFGDTHASNATSELGKGAMEDVDSLKGPAEPAPVAHEEDLSRGRCARTMYSPEERIIAGQV